MKTDWYKAAEAVMYEYYTLETAISNLKRAGQPDSIKRAEQKQLLKDCLDEIILKLSKADQDLLSNTYNNPDIANNMQLTNLLSMSTATFYRTKRNILKGIALRLGLL